MHATTSTNSKFSPSATSVDVQKPVNAVINTTSEKPSIPSQKTAFSAKPSIPNKPVLAEKVTSSCTVNL